MKSDKRHFRPRHIYPFEGFCLKQKWYYSVQREDDEFLIELGKPREYQHFKWKHYDIDLGTAAAHLWLGLIRIEMELEIFLSNDEGDAVWKFRIAVK